MGEIISFGEAQKRLPKQEKSREDAPEKAKIVRADEARDKKLFEKVQCMEAFLMKLLGSDEVAFAGVPYPEDIKAKREAIKGAEVPTTQLERYITQSGEAQWESAPAFYLALLEELRERGIIPAREK